jgi:hypothetical protein
VYGLDVPDLLVDDGLYVMFAVDDDRVLVHHMPLYHGLLLDHLRCGAGGHGCSGQ